MSLRAFTLIIYEKFISLETKQKNCGQFFIYLICKGVAYFLETKKLRNKKRSGNVGNKHKSILS